jgi:hypothetical protein
MSVTPSALTRGRLYLSLVALIASIGLAWALAFTYASSATAAVPEALVRPAAPTLAPGISFEPFAHPVIMFRADASYPIPTPTNAPKPGTALMPDGERSALVSTDIAVATAGGLTIAQSSAIATAIGGALVSAGVVATAPAWLPLAVIGVGFAAVVGGIGLAYYHATHSPANPHFSTIVNPVPVHLPALFSAPGNFAPVATSETKLLTATLQVSADSKAFWQAQDRAHGAWNARNRTWYERQLRASAADVRNSAKLVGQMPTLLGSIQSALADNHMSVTVPTSGQASAGSIISAIGAMHLGPVLKKLDLVKPLEQRLAAGVPGTTPATVAFPQELNNTQVDGLFVQSAHVLARYASIVRQQERKPFPQSH